MGVNKLNPGNKKIHDGHLQRVEEKNQREQRVTEVGCEKPERDWRKANIDGSSTHQQCHGGATTMIRDENGMFLSAITQPLQNKSSFYTIYEGCKLGLQVALASVITKLQVELDYEALIKIMTGEGQEMTMEVATIIEDIRFLCLKL